MNTTSQTEPKDVYTNYRGWTISRRFPHKYWIHREGWQSYGNFKSLENAKTKVDAIVG